MSKKIAIIFAYMKNNLGDDIFIQLLCERYPDTQFYIATLDAPNKSLKQIPNLHFSSKMKDYENGFVSPNLSSRVKRYFSKFDASIIIGGSIFMQNGNNWQGQVQQNKNRAALSRKLFIIGANFGPFRDENFLREYRNLFMQIKDVCFRDSDSIGYFPDVKTVRWAPDVIFTCRPSCQDTKPQVLISVIDCSWAGRPQLQMLKECVKPYEDKLVEVCSEFYRKGNSICLVSFCEYQRDNIAAQRIMQRCLSNGVTDIKICEYTGNIPAVLDEIARSKYVLATRFHAMILGWLCGKPTYPIIYDQKQKSVIRDLDFHGRCCNITEFGDEDASIIIKSLTEYQSFDCGRYVAEAQKQFAALDKFLNE